MKKMYKSRNEENLLPFHIIKAASEGDVSAINAVLKHYEGYIIKLSTRKLYDESGQVHYCIDETLRRRLETTVSYTHLCCCCHLKIVKMMLLARY